jgi:mRNA-degrading endonuclease RelE of RelBE toxin-antitoxin system
MAEIKLTVGAAADLEALGEPLHTRVLNILERLTQWPAVSGAKPLTGRLAGAYRIRTGDYRVQFRVSGEVVLVERIGHRDGFYER